MAKATNTITTGLVFVAILVSVLPHIGAQSPAPAPGPVMMAPSPSLDCLDILIDIYDCLTFVESESNLTKPEPGCCPALAKFVQTQPVCLCKLLGNSSDVGVEVDTKRALMLPSLCSINTPPISLCAAIGYPVGVPAPSPSPGGSSAGSPSENGGLPSNLIPNQDSVVGLILALSAFFFF